MQASSFVFLGGGVHANSERDLERIANTTLSPFLLTALRQADRQVADRQVIRRSTSAMTSAGPTHLVICEWLHGDEALVGAVDAVLQQVYCPCES
jgi:hypothetical protein